jgi:hypothetical protein
MPPAVTAMTRRSPLVKVRNTVVCTMMTAVAGAIQTASCGISRSARNHASTAARVALQIWRTSKR